MKRFLQLTTFTTIALMLIFSVTTISAQTDQGRISGTVSDETGAVIAGATVTIKNNGTNQTRTATSDDKGYYFVPALNAAVYTITVTAPSFAATNVTDVQISVSQQLDLPLLLTAAGQTLTVEVTASSEAAIDTSSARMGATVNGREVEDLPLNGRQLSQLYLQAPGTVNTGTGTYGDIRFSGRANQQNVIRYDGVEGSAIIDSSPGNLNGEVASPFRLQSSLENVQEFRADSNNFPAEYGTGTGGQISVVTKSGTNQFHGSLFEYFRNEALDASNFFDNTVVGVPKSILRLNQFGGSLGGAIVKNKLFFFGSYEGYRVRAGVNAVELVPKLSLATLANIPGTSTPISNNVRPFIAGFRSPDAVIIPNSDPNSLFDFAQLQSAEKTNEDSFSGRLDFRPNESNSFYLRYFYDNGTDDTPEGVSGRRVLIKAKPQNGVFGWQKIINAKMLNEFRLGYNAAKTSIQAVAPTINGIDYSAISINVSGTVAQLPSNTIAGQGQSAGISVPGGLVRANSATNGRGQPYSPYSLSFLDTLNYAVGNHNAKFGGEVRLVRLKTDRLGGTTYTFSNLNNFLAGTLQQIQYVGDLSAASPFTDVSGEREAQQEYYILYGQDEWKVRPNLTFSYGLRYEYYAPLREKNNGQVLFDLNTGTLRDPSEAAYKSSKSNFGPRVAATYSPFGKLGFFGGSRSVIRAGFGIYYGPGQTEDQIQPIESDRISSSVSGGTFSGNPTADANAIASSFVNNPLTRRFQPRAYASDYTIPERIYQYSVSMQQELPYNLVGTVAYVGSQGRNLFLRSVTNQILPGSATILNGANLPSGVGVINRTNAAGQVIGVTTVRQFDVINGSTLQTPFAEIDYKTSGGEDSYNALQTQLSRRFDSGLTMNAQYTYASSYGTSAGSNEARTSAQLENFEADRGRNNFDVRHSFNVSALYALPIGKGKKFDFGNSVANFALGDWEVGGILNARSGLPIEVLVVRPDTVAQCVQASGCLVTTGVSATGTTTMTVPNGYTVNLPTVGNGAPNGTTFNAPPLPTGFVAIINTPGGGASRNVRRPTIVAGQPFYLNNDRNIINPAAFAIPVAGAYGDLSRNALRGPIFRQFDLTLSKRFKVTERATIQFRTEIFNLLNTTNFANPSATLNNALPSFAAVNPSSTNTLTTPTFTVNPASASVLQSGQAFNQTQAGSSFGLIRSTVGRTVGLGTNRQIQFALRLNF